METETIVEYLAPQANQSSLVPSKRRLRILCLHGYKQNATVFKSKTAVLRKSLDDIADFIYIDAPHIVDEAKGSASWWRATGDGKEYRGWETTLDYIRNIFIKKGPFDGILGFSQGAVLGSLLCSISSLNSDTSIERGDGYKDISFNFALLFSGFQSRATVHQSLYPCSSHTDGAESAAASNNNNNNNDNNNNNNNSNGNRGASSSSPEVNNHYPFDKITTPSLHVWGKSDELVAASNCESLSHQFSEPECYVHEHGHLMPTSKLDVAHYKTFLLKFFDYYEA
ncbi:hypothetical protein SAMD00019534_016850 [Acytostelium subglobosum LB1]|uniref:hypothetical protein n=1 Tax=Acytostelium subglobosum LB1 TaxID=1410327 RepID=UPI000645115E|nr:hypothetical protein SAMD00019534_016850 [Acytostelium subglobosum LB1]GAM18510.1 hypothetical protein SAMD00019534_016850 [Acytostelium subglobosum LB1]|eukprot:XP_012757730.1 hypothetical protein SAMD00019534_016850 [Acytostelium subglobosum LB1]